jgi:hypothetical protein
MNWALTDDKVRNFVKRQKKKELAKKGNKRA